MARPGTDTGWAYCFGLLLGCVTFAHTGTALGADQMWRGLVVAPEYRCTRYHSDDYRYPQSVEPRIIAEMGG